MKTSTTKILTTHTGSLPRSPDMQDKLRLVQDRSQMDRDAFQGDVKEAVAEVVRKQQETGLDVINDGEQGRVQYASYVRERLSGFEGELAVRPRDRLDLAEFPEYAVQMSHSSSFGIPQPTCTGPITWKDWPAVQRDIDTLQSAAEGSQVEEIFMTSASPGVIATFLPNEHYPDDEAYLYALAGVMKDEYRAIVEAGLLLQIDCPDLAMVRSTEFSHLTETEFLKVVELHVEVINFALAGLPPDRMRLHLCWGNTETPHHYDVPLKELLPMVLKALPTGLSFEGANPRHAHEWKIWRDIKLPEGKVLIPGVIDSTTNFIEHPELVAERIIRYAEIVGRENVIAGTDCGFGTSTWGRKVDTRIAWAKLQTMVEGAKLATQELF